MGRTAVRNERGHDRGAWRRGTRAAAALVAVVGALAALALGARSASAQITATFTNPIGISEVQSLNFGTLIPSPTTPGSVTIGPDGGLSWSVVTPLPSNFDHARFRVTGDLNHAYDITLPPNDTIELTSGANTMTIETFTSSPSESGKISFFGFQNLDVGATLTVGANQEGGIYTGTFKVEVNYQ